MHRPPPLIGNAVRSSGGAPRQRMAMKHAQGGKRALVRQVQHGPYGFAVAGPFWPNKANPRFARPNNGLHPGHAGFPSGTFRHPLSRLAGTA